MRQSPAGQISTRDFSDLVGAIYDCGGAPERWGATLACLCAEIGASFLTLSITTKADLGCRTIHASPWDMDAIWRLHQKYVHYIPGALDQLTGPLNTAFVSSRRPQNAAERRSIFHSEWMKPQGLRDYAMVKFADADDVVGCLCWSTSERRGPISLQETALIETLAPHIHRAWSLGGSLETAVRERDAAREALDALTLPVYLVGAGGRLLYSNEAGAGRLLAGPLTRDGAGCLAAAAAPGREPFAFALKQAADGGARGSVALSDETGRPCIARVLPLTPGRALRAGEEPRAAVFLASETRKDPPRHDLVAALYDLTPAEARVMLRIGQGLTVPDVCAALDISQATARTHIARIFAKTGVARQADLVALVAALSLPVADAAEEAPSAPPAHPGGLPAPARRAVRRRPAQQPRRALGA